MILEYYKNIYNVILKKYKNQTINQNNNKFKIFLKIQKCYMIKLYHNYHKNKNNY